MLGFGDLRQVGVYHAVVVDAYALYSFIHIEYIYNTRESRIEQPLPDARDILKRQIPDHLVLRHLRRQDIKITDQLQQIIKHLLRQGIKQIRPIYLALNLIPLILGLPNALIHKLLYTHNEPLILRLQNPRLRHTLKIPLNPLFLLPLFPHLLNQPIQPLQILNHILPIHKRHILQKLLTQLIEIRRYILAEVESQFVDYGHAGAKDRHELFGVVPEAAGALQKAHSVDDAVGVLQVDAELCADEVVVLGFEGFQGDADRVDAWDVP